MEVISVKKRFDMVGFFKKLRSEDNVPCPECEKGHFIPCGKKETTKGFYCSNCGIKVNID